MRKGAFYVKKGGEDGYFVPMTPAFTTLFLPLYTSSRLPTEASTPYPLFHVWHPTCIKWIDSFWWCRTYTFPTIPILSSLIPRRLLIVPPPRARKPLYTSKQVSKSS